MESVQLHQHYPKKREVLCCDFAGMKEPEMIKERPVVILAYSPVARPGLAIIIPLSTSPPKPVQPWHHKLSLASQWDKIEHWAKCDMIYTLSIGRLSPWKIGKDPQTGKRKYLNNFFVSVDDFSAIHACVLKAMNIELQK
jgi:mRNA interferase MazF